MSRFVCFLSGTETPGEEPYLTIEDVEGKQNVKSVGQLGHALCNEKLTESALVRIYWPREKCPLLRDDVVFVDSPGIDVSPNLDEWIDKHCLDADVFVLVANAESTLMVTVSLHSPTELFKYGWIHSFSFIRLQLTLTFYSIDFHRKRTSFTKSPHASPNPIFLF